MSNPESFSTEEVNPIPVEKALEDKLQAFDQQERETTIPGSPSDSPAMRILSKEIKKTMINEGGTPENNHYLTPDVPSEPGNAELEQ